MLEARLRQVCRVVGEFAHVMFSHVFFLVVSGISWDHRFHQWDERQKIDPNNTTGIQIPWNAKCC